MSPNRKLNAYGSASSWITVDLGEKKIINIIPLTFSHTQLT